MAWLSLMNILQENVLNRDPRRFLRWNVISRTMFAGNASYISTELKYLKNCLDWNMRWTSAIEESSPGNIILIDDAREFTGQNNYPTLEEVEKIVLGKKAIG